MSFASGTDRSSSSPSVAAALAPGAVAASVRPDPSQALSVFDLFTIGVGPSSSHTVGPMRAARAFAILAVDEARRRGVPTSLGCRLLGSLGLTGRGHATDRAVILGLLGFRPEALDPDMVPSLLADVAQDGVLRLGGAVGVPFQAGRDLLFHGHEFHGSHPNTLELSARFADGFELHRAYHSVGGGTVVEAGFRPVPANVLLPHGFTSAAELLAEGERTGMSIAAMMAANERSFRSDAETEGFLDAVRDAMDGCIERGCAGSGELPGGLGVRRRARHTLLALRDAPEAGPHAVFEWVSLWALAVNEENAAGGRVVTAPTNGAAGVLPAVLRYYERFVPGASREGARTFLLTAAAIGFLYKKRASISAAEMGCQGEVGVACSMAAGALCAVLGGSNAQIENAAEIGMEHNLGLTCDPIGGLVQVPCIERNAMGAVKAINAALLALRGDGRHVVSLDAVIETMRQTGEDMRSKYKETSLGGLAVNVVEC
ncbi:L-serine ammonia-lyase [Rhizosaccharibacter radicis]|uniref:L-serine ammonia-lyase n=1 Tax=Rhizosaccharibacter radicis TaxID=2782605 RepID=A0ABT1VVG5_9PROT|nr:L-serine ammonia-lyase [Acetobacteraceae bacterium KSS12]